MGCCASKEDWEIPSSGVSNKYVLKRTSSSIYQPHKVENGFLEQQKELAREHGKVERSKKPLNDISDKDEHTPPSRLKPQSSFREHKKEPTPDYKKAESFKKPFGKISDEYVQEHTPPGRLKPNQNANSFAEHKKKSTPDCDKTESSDKPLGEISDKNVQEHTPSGTLKQNQIEKEFVKHKKEPIPDYDQTEPVDEPLSDISNQEVLEHTPPSRLKPYKIENDFWEHKRRLIPEYGKMKRLDKRALQAPSSLKENPQKLVDYLTKDLTSELEKARILIRWMGDNIAYDVDYLETGVRGDYSIENVLRTGRSVCGGYSDVLEHFCRLADVECKAISGLSKGGSYYPGKVFDTSGNDPGAHAWNKVKIENQWYLCDPTWAAGAVDLNGSQFWKRWDDSWFLTHPDAFLSTHLPFKRDKGVLTSEQLVSKPVTSLDAWNDNVLSDPIPHAYNIHPITHPKSVIEVQSPELRITYSNPSNHAMKQWTEFRQHRSKQNIPDRVMLYAVGKTVRVDVRLPGKGSYSLEILGKIVTPEWPNEKSDTTQAYRLFWYKIDYDMHRGKKGFIPSGAGAEWGMTPQYQAAGFKLLPPESPIIQTKNGVCQIQMQLPTRGVFPSHHRLHHAKANTSELEPCVYGEKEGNKATYHIRCPYPGEYRFEIYYKPAPESGPGGYYTGAAFLIVCQNPAENAKCYTDCSHLFGPLPEFNTRFGLSVTLPSSTVKTKNGEASIIIDKTRSVKLFANLHYTGNLSSNVAQTSTDRSTTFNIKRKGFFKLFACEEHEKSGPLVAIYFVTS